MTTQLSFPVADPTKAQVMAVVLAFLDGSGNVVPVTATNPLPGSGGGGGGGAITAAAGAFVAGALAAGAIADGADVTQGLVADVAVAADAPGSISAKLRTLTKNFGAWLTQLVSGNGQVSTLLNNVSAVGAGSTVSWTGGWGIFEGVNAGNTFGGSSLILETLSRDGATWIACGVSTTLSQNGQGRFCYPAGTSLRARLSGGAPASISAFMFGVPA